MQLYHAYWQSDHNQVHHNRTGQCKRKDYIPHGTVISAKQRAATGTASDKKFKGGSSYEKLFSWQQKPHKSKSAEIA